MPLTDQLLSTLPTYYFK